MLHKLAPENDHIIVQAENDTKGQTRQIFFLDILKHSTVTGGLPTTNTNCFQKAKIMLNVNVDGFG